MGRCRIGPVGQFTLAAPRNRRAHAASIEQFICHKTNLVVSTNRRRKPNRLSRVLIPTTILYHPCPLPCLAEGTRSASSCGDLGWAAVPSVRPGGEAVCGASILPVLTGGLDDLGAAQDGCSGEVSWASAAARCGGAGGRLCTVGELLLGGDALAGAAGCGYGARLAWSSTPCGGASDGEARFAASGAFEAVRGRLYDASYQVCGDLLGGPIRIVTANLTQTPALAFSLDFFV